MANIQTSLKPKLGLVEATGDHYQIGLALGRGAARALREQIPLIGRFRALKRNAEALRALDSLEEAGRDSFPEIMREVDGIAAGSGMDFRDVWLWNCRGDFAGGGDQSKSALAGCTTVLLPGTAEKPAIIGHNEDDQAELDGSCFLARVVPDDGPAFLSFYSPGLLPGHTFAVNDAGLVQTINHIRPYDQRRGIPRHVIARAVLSQSSIKDAVALLQREDRASGFHHNLGICGEPRLYSVEAPASGCVVEEISKRPRAHTNHLVYDRFADLNQELATSSRDRLRRAEALIGEGGLTERNPLVILQDSAGIGMPIYRKGSYAGDTGYTLATVIFEIGADSIDWRIFTDADTEVEHLGSVGVN
ncbi:MAG: C45 family peptidase [Gammaproteobacteria bacterium]|nr:C45 family peptidase [Gammaproteobacteria bacterium]